MPVTLLDQSCRCPCGASTFTVHGRPVVRFLCHCLICQSLYQRPFADVTALWASSVRLPADSKVRFKHYRPPPALNRGTCPSCQAPVVGFLRLAPFLRLGFVPSQNFSCPAELPTPSAHVFYHRRVKDVSDELPKVSGYWPSEFLVTRFVVRSLLPGHANE